MKNVITRTYVNAVVSYEKVWKDSEGIHTDMCEEKLLKCENKEKAEIMLAKQNKGAIISLLDAQFTETTVAVDEDKFFEMAEVISEKEIDEKPVRKRSTKSE